MITSLNRLCSEIHTTVTNPELFQTIRPLLSRYQGHDWINYTRYNTTTYDRVKIYTCPFFDMYILTWAPKSSTKVHDHAEYGCWLKILQGRLLETIYDHDPYKLSDDRLLDTDQVSFIHNSIGLHSIHNNNLIPAVSLHVYAPRQT